MTRLGNSFPGNETFDHEPVDRDWLAEFRNRFAEEFPEEVRTENRIQCDRCQGNGEVVTDWDKYLHAHGSRIGDEAVAECPDCSGIGWIVEPDPDQSAQRDVETGGERPAREGRYA